ncbi:hypothetical protein FE257_011477 [Aspergillus nanangensis]|uniref:Zn(2)-C6 fungal-type domain-containing protein n=1 Tax=Aspergillus nanangensis TaxID=2582783 RepID=A0AAD4CH87_ASPNN|nr:hypothetical protein FE257_011477 [Aspergillus nanangensis]
MDDATAFYSLRDTDSNSLLVADQSTSSHAIPSEWLWGSAPLSPGSMPPVGFSPYTLPQVHEANRSSSSRSSYDVNAAPKVAIPRATSISHHSQRRRSARACEPCRQRKIKCDGNKPACRQCVEQNVHCSYVDVKRVRDQKQLSVLAKKVHRYEKLLSDLEHDAEGSMARRVRRALKASDQPSSAEDESYDSADETSSMGSLEEIDLVEEDLNRNEKSIATGFFGKNSEVSWMQRLEDEAETRSRIDEMDHPKVDIPIATVSYHLDDLNIPFLESVDPYDLPPKDVADQYFAAYMESVHPSFMVIRHETYAAQYRQFFSQPSRPPRRWLAILNMIFAIGCRYCQFMQQGEDPDTTNDLIYLNRARKLSLSGNVLFEHADLQQIQVEFLAAFYLVSSGQVNRAFKLSSIAFRSALSLGINLRFEDNRVHYAAKEARSRLWWSIYLLEHLLTALTGRVSCVGEGLSATPLPIPFDEEALGHPEAAPLFQDQALRLQRLKMTLLQTEEESRAAAAWLATCPPSASLIFHCLVDLATITQAVINKIYSIQGLRERPSKLDQRIRRYKQIMDTWRAKLPQCCRFTESPDSDRLSLSLDDSDSSPFKRERVRLALAYYSARITLCRPCLPTGSGARSRSNSHSQSPANDHDDIDMAQSQTTSVPPPPNPLPRRGSGSRGRLRAEMSLVCLQSACTLIDILPDTPDTLWLARYTPWWSILHYLMQATTALLLGLFHATCSGSAGSDGSSLHSPRNNSIHQHTLNISNIHIQNTHRNLSAANPKQVPGSIPGEISADALIKGTQKALHWLLIMGQTHPASKRAFVLCDSFIRRVAPRIGLDISGFPVGDGSFAPGGSMSGTASAASGGSAARADGWEYFEEWEEWL